MFVLCFILRTGYFSGSLQIEPMPLVFPLEEVVLYSRNKRTLTMRVVRTGFRVTAMKVFMDPVSSLVVACFCYGISERSGPWACIVTRTFPSLLFFCRVWLQGVLDGPPGPLLISNNPA
jgi:hypothetical protein